MTHRFAVLACTLVIAALAAYAYAEDSIQLIDEAKENGGWSFGNGPEFPGATGNLELFKGAPRNYQPALKLYGDFTKGGNYVQASVNLPKKPISALSFWLHAPGAKQITIRLIDGNGRCHQINIRLEESDTWRKVRFPVTEFFAKMGTSASIKSVMKYESWGGNKKDSKWKDPGRALCLLVGRHSFGKSQKGEFGIGRVTFYTAAPASPPYNESFDGQPASWKRTTHAAFSADQPFKGKHCLALARTEAQLEEPAVATGPAFPAAPGRWELGGTLRGDLHSPDNSYCGAVVLEMLDANGKLLQHTEVALLCGQQDWKPFRKTVTMPRDTGNARFRVELKKTYGTFAVDEISARHIPGPVAVDDRIARLLISTNRLGNLLYPDDKPVAHLKIEARSKLEPGFRTATCVLRDYWGAEMAPPFKVELAEGPHAGELLTYQADVDLSAAKLATGVYYELYVSIPRASGDDCRDYRGLAVLPEAATKKLKPADVPFTIRNWDNRIRDYFYLADRIGIRQIGIWGGWNSNDPTKVYAPGIDYCKELGAVWVTGTPGSNVERQGFKNITEDNLRHGMQNFLKAYAGKGMHMICLGNEPHGDEKKIEENVRAYKALYEGAKEVNPDAFIIATSVPPDERYFKAGYHKYCDAYDFHIYEHYDGIRKQIAGYNKLMKEYNAPKPVFCTELGLNSQGMTRHAVAIELIKKISVFFAAGGKSVSWFTIQYPDPKGTARGQSGDSHNTFDCKYNQFNPRLDAIAYYYMVNGISVKKFVEEKLYENEIQSYLFRDAEGHCMQVLWKEGDRVTAHVPIEGVENLELIRVDGSRHGLAAHKGGVTLSISSEPLLLFFDQKTGGLAKELGQPGIALATPAAPIMKGGERVISLKGEGITAKAVQVDAPPRWEVNLRDADGLVECVVRCPDETDAREGRLYIHWVPENEKAAGELIVSLQMMSPLSVEALPSAKSDALDIHLRNNGGETKEVRWDLSMPAEFPMEKGSFNISKGQPPKAFFGEAPEGQVVLAGGQERIITVPLKDIDPLILYRVQAIATDDLARSVSHERFVSGFARAAKTDEAPQLDGKLEEKSWRAAQVHKISDPRQVYRMRKVAENSFENSDDLSGEVRILWDEDHLYLGVKVTDDVYAAPQCDSAIWNQDGLQILVDPNRTIAQKDGKYDYSLASGTKGPQAWCHLSAHAGIKVGPAEGIRVAMDQPDKASGHRSYEVAIPWRYVAPFKPATGANLGLALILNEDDGHGREGFMGWFSGVHSKQLDLIGDIILAE